jgi:hypothetical protein
VSGASSVTADGGSSYTGTVTALDVNDNLVPGAVVTFSAPSQVSVSASSCTTDASGKCQVTFTSTKAGSWVVSASVPAGTIGSQSLVFVAGPPDLGPNGKSSLTLSGSPAPDDGTSAVTGTAMLLDKFANPVSGVTVQFGVGAGQVSRLAAARLSGPSCTTGSDGACTDSVTATKADTFMVSAWVGANTAADNLAGSPAPAVFSSTAKAPLPPVVDPTNGTKVTGTAQPGTTVTVYDSVRNVLGTGSADPVTGAFTVQPLVPRPSDGAVLYVTATDSDGNESAPTAVTVHSVPPAPPVLDPSDGTKVTGTAQPGTTVTVYGPDGKTVLGTAVADPVNGAFTVEPLNGYTPKNGDVLSVTATDEYGNVSDPAYVTVDTSRPVAANISVTTKHITPVTVDVLAKSTGTRLTLVSVNTPPHGVTQDVLGKVVYTPPSDFAGVLSFGYVIADVFGHTATGTVTVTVLPGLPLPPVVNPTDGTEVSGTTSPNVTVTVTCQADGAVLGTGTSDASGHFDIKLVANSCKVLVVTATNAAGSSSTTVTVTPKLVVPVTPSSGGLAFTGAVLVPTAAVAALLLATGLWLLLAGARRRRAGQGSGS